MTTINDALPLTHIGNVPKGRTVSFYRVSCWRGGHFIADFALRSEAEAFAISDARAKNCRYDHMVEHMRMTRGV